MQFPCCVGLLQVAQIEFPKATRENLYRQEEPWTAGHPTAAVQGDATTRHDTMQMGMKIEGLSPRMQDAEKSDLRSQVLRIGCHRLQGIGGGSEQEIVHLAFVLESQRGQFRRQGKHHMEVLTIQQLRLPLL